MSSGLWHHTFFIICTTSSSSSSCSWYKKKLKYKETSYMLFASISVTMQHKKKVHKKIKIKKRKRKNEFYIYQKHNLKQISIQLYLAHSLWFVLCTWSPNQCTATLNRVNFRKNNVKRIMNSVFCVIVWEMGKGKI